MATRNNDFVYFDFADKAHKVSQYKEYNWKTYVDRNGKTCGFEMRKDNSGNPVYKRYTIGGGRKQIRVRRNHTAEIAIIKDHPECEGSINYPEEGGKIMFKMIDRLEASANIVQRQEMENKVNNLIFSMDGKRLREAALTIAACDDESDMMQKSSLINLCKKDPYNLWELLNDPSNEAVALFKDAQRLGIISKHGITFKFGDEHLPGTENDIASRILNDGIFKQTLLAHVTQALEKEKREREEKVADDVNTLKVEKRTENKEKKKDSMEKARKARADKKAEKEKEVKE